jgi:hypothetical protein
VDLFQTNPEAIQALRLEIENGRLALPEFQRDFIWEPENTASLLSSIIARYPAGSLLFWRPSEVTLEPRAIADAPSVDSSAGLERLILDGQQRLTALYRALAGKTAETYFLVLDELIDVSTFELKDEDSINWDLVVEARELTAAERKSLAKNPPVEPEHYSLDWQHEHYRFPLTANFDDWMTDLIDDSQSDEVKKQRREVLRGIRDNYLSQLTNYRFPVTTLTDAATLTAVCTVFEKLNTNTVTLGPYEVLTAKFFKDGVQLRKLWEDARAEHSVLRDPRDDNDHSGFGIDPYLILQIITLVAHGSPQRKAVLEKLRAADVDGGWHKVVLALKRVIEWLRDSCGVVHRNLLPYQAILIPITGAWLKRDEMKGAAKAQALDKIGQYFWASVFTTNFDQGAASQAETDYRDLAGWLNGDVQNGEEIKPEAVATLPIAADTILTATASKTALHRGVMALTIRAGARDFHRGQALTPQIYIEEKVNSHHLYPRARLADAHPETGIDSSGHGSELILNRTLIDAETNRRIGARKPSVYVEDIREAEADVEALFESHLIDTEKLESDQYGEFVMARLAAVVEKIEEVTGKSVAPLAAEGGEIEP